MMQDSRHDAALRRLSAILARRGQDRSLDGMIAAQKDVRARFAPIFAPEALSELTADQMRSFLSYRNNRHWKGLDRLGPSITRDMDALRQALRELLDESRPIAERLDALLPRGRARVRRLGKAVLTPILLIVYPDRYGVWNAVVESAMQTLGIWPEFERGLSVGRKYERLNSLMLRIASDLAIDLWTLDGLWWRVETVATGENEEAGTDDELSVDEAPADDAADEDRACVFGLERYLHEFLLDNWDATPLGAEWELLEEEGDVNGYGSERPTPVGRIDLLARHRREPRLLVVELKRNQASDRTVGQILRYMGWVRENLATDGEAVEGLVIAHEGDDRLRYALSGVPDVRFMRYEVEFRLREV
ncbi:MAG: hypothetical protein Kow0062_18940 [Acidobacteriota bacterium]